MSDNSGSSANPIDLPFERSIYVTNFISSIVYGMILLMFILSVQYARNSTISTKQKIFHVIWGFVIVLCTGIGDTVIVVYGEIAWIEQRNAPGGPLAYIIGNQNIWYQVWGTAAAILLIFSADVLLLIRCYIIWSSNWKIVVFPALMSLTSFALGIVFTIQSAQPTGFFAGKALDFGTPFYSITISLNVILTILICTKLFSARRNMINVGMSDRNLYTGVIAMLTEGAVLSSVSGLAFIITFARQSDVAPAFSAIWGISVSLVQMMIIFRVLKGHAWSQQTSARFTSTALNFASNKSRDHELGIELHSGATGTLANSTMHSKQSGVFDSQSKVYSE